VRPGVPLTLVTIDCGFPLEALVTRESCQELEITPGAPVTALVKAPNVHLVPRTAIAP
jgi:molybdopterin-binding protein